MTEQLTLLYKQRKNLLDNGFDIFSEEVEAIEEQIGEIEYLPSFDEVIKLISYGKMKSIFN